MIQSSLFQKFLLLLGVVVVSGCGVIQSNESDTVDELGGGEIGSPLLLTYVDEKVGYETQYYSVTQVDRFSTGVSFVTESVGSVHILHAKSCVSLKEALNAFVNSKVDSELIEAQFDQLSQICASLLAQGSATSTLQPTDIGTGVGQSESGSTPSTSNSSGGSGLATIAGNVSVGIVVLSSGVFWRIVRLASGFFVAFLSTDSTVNHAIAGAPYVHFVEYTLEMGVAPLEPQYN